ncbi:MAG: ATP-dependent Clp protease adapter ClpS [Desulfobacula sp.]|jgi:ATP-dependent Clp protease adaptor protein ClpS|uniref:ATP-dependent Clp protease adapter ClpS n=1 Tax=Desulfobacula sp. TaxID=2593537 RepID=UPI001D6DE902|nr:ATP-dependent Clp protease adapter ClpS [Desulfobacula sp.]MBT3484120.1 ATP-dependent Clp protease adapter ClpS [Desulfobacula sp.]MBT3803767.1 ATP-dependent Clp protease adapter ClpS [Desulfobacula sp.]MBT4024472.1 ATP-dependent Clp protease adapter ClpS [Desulfobacula sp.]MBT4198513.1 ATP-dependent Clp protease adapter ClpS [Desulfobacula sp.]
MAYTESEIKEDISSRSKNDLPPMYKVILHNDDYTSMEFVVQILVNVFGKSLEKATQIMLNIHNKGKEICGIYPRQIAETKIETVHHLANSKGFPLKSTMEKE